MTRLETYKFLIKEKGFIKSEYDCGTNEISIDANGIVALYMVADILETLGSKFDKTPMEIAHDAIRIKTDATTVREALELLGEKTEELNEDFIQ